MSGQFVHVEIAADDTGASREFWGSLFGWQFEEFTGSPAEYHMARVGEAQSAAVSNAEPGKRGMRPYLEVDAIGASATRVRELGGHADDPLPVPGMGWFATCRDPHGNEFGLWQTDPSASMPAS